MPKDLSLRYESEMKRVFNPFDILLQDVIYWRLFKNDHPQCADCEHVKEPFFSKNYYESFVKEECRKCENMRVSTLRILRGRE